MRSTLKKRKKQSSTKPEKKRQRDRVVKCSKSSAFRRLALGYKCLHPALMWIWEYMDDQSLRSVLGKTAWIQNMPYEHSLSFMITYICGLY